MKTLSFIIPLYNEEKNIPLLYSALREVIGNYLTNYNYEILFVDDGSKDASLDEVKKLWVKDSRVKYIRFAKNFGKEIGTSAGLQNCSGDAAIALDCDLQHPVQLIPQMIKRWEDGARIVVGVRASRKEESIVKKFGSWLYYKVFNRLSSNRTIPNSTDFRLLDRQVINEFKRFGEHSRMTRSLIDWLGFEMAVEYFDAPERMYGKASYSYVKLVKLAISGIVSNSLFPLRLAGYLGFVISLFSLLLGAYVVIGKYFLHEPLASSITGTAQLAILIMFMVGIILVCLGLVSLYIANIYTEVINRPLYVVSETNCDNNS